MTKTVAGEQVRKTMRKSRRSNHGFGWHGLAQSGRVSSRAPHPTDVVGRACHAALPHGRGSDRLCEIPISHALASHWEIAGRDSRRRTCEILDNCKCCQGRAGFSHQRRAVTLLEMLLAMSLLVLLSSMTYWFYSSALRTRETGTQFAQKLQLSRVVLQRLAGEIRQASIITADQRVGLRGEAERIWLSTLRVPSREVSLPRGTFEDPPPGEYDLVKVEYKIARHPDIEHPDGYPEALGLARVEHRIPRPDSAQTGEAFEDEEVILPPVDGNEDGNGQTDEDYADAAEERRLFKDEEESQAALGPDINWEELYSKEIRFLRFCYYDGARWWDDWDVAGESPLPQLVQVTIGFESHPPFDDKFGFRDEEAERFCTCLNEDPVDCLPLPEDQYTMTVRVPQADPLFRSRVAKETQSLLQEVGTEAPQ